MTGSFMVSYTRSNNIDYSKPFTVFDIDGVLIDNTERLQAVLDELDMDDIPARGEARRRFWKLFLSDKYLHLDKPVKEAVKLLRRRRDEGYQILLITGRPENMMKATIKQLEDYGIEYDMIVFRAENNYMRDHKYKEEVLRALGITNNVYEAHDDSLHVVEVYIRYVRLRVFYWYRPGKYIVFPPYMVYVTRLLIGNIA